MRLLTPILFAATCCLFTTSAIAANHHVIICGSGGEEAYVKKFADWGDRLQAALVDHCAAEPDRVLLLTESDAERPSTLEGIRAAFHDLESCCTPEDTVWVYLIGHGSFRRNVSKLNIPGPDLAAEDLDALLDSLPAQQAVIVNAASSGAGFINVLSGPGRVVCSATKDVEQRNATEYMEHFIRALVEGGADQDRDERISILEACTHAAALTAAWYENEHLIATENAILDDDGDGLGTRLPIAGDQGDGRHASAIFLRDEAFPEGVAAAQIESYRDALAAVEALKARKAELEESQYYAELERLLIDAARAHRTLRSPTAGGSEGGAPS